MIQSGLYNLVESATAAIAHQMTVQPKVAIVLGSGLGALANRVVHDRVVISYDAIPGFVAPGVEGHAGLVVTGTLAGVPVLIFQGRFHYYEGHDLSQTTLPMRVAHELGVQTVILTAATGGIAQDLRPGDICCLSDHINLMGSNPLRGPYDPRLGVRFPDMTQVYAESWRKRAETAAEKLGIALKPAVYAALSGPSYETPAEIRMLRALGADVVGMSTVPEAIVARSMGLEVLAFAMVTNAAAGLDPDPSQVISHVDVLDVAKATGDLVASLIIEILSQTFQSH